MTRGLKRTKIQQLNRQEMLVQGILTSFKRYYGTLQVEWEEEPEADISWMVVNRMLGPAFTLLDGAHAYILSAIDLEVENNE